MYIYKVVISIVVCYPSEQNNFALTVRSLCIKNGLYLNSECIWLHDKTSLSDVFLWELFRKRKRLHHH